MKVQQPFLADKRLSEMEPISRAHHGRGKTQITSFRSDMNGRVEIEG